jgi:hypothetical protein
LEVQDERGEPEGEYAADDASDEPAERVTAGVEVLGPVGAG